MTTPWNELLRQARREGLKVAQAEARVGAALREPDMMTPRERWQVDLSVPRFEWFEGEELLFGGPVQLVGTFVEGDGFLWGRHNESVHRAGWEALFSKLDAMPELAPALAERAFEATLGEVRLVATWLSARAGFTGCFLGALGHATACLAVQVQGPEALGPGAGGCCFGCGALRRQCRRMLGGPEGVLVCDACMAQFAEAAGPEVPGELDGLSPLDERAAPVLRFCVLCSEVRPALIMGQSAGVCRACARIGAEVLARGE